MTEKWYNLYNLEPQFKNFLLAENVSSITLKNYLSDLRYFFGWLQSLNNKKSIKSEAEINKIINKETIIKYLQYLIENKLPKKTINRRLSTIRKFCSFCISQSWLKENPAKKISNLQKNTNFYKEYKENKVLEKPKYYIFKKIKNLISNKINQSKNSLQKQQIIDFSFQQYIGFVILLVFIATLGAGIYSQFFQKSEKSFAYPLSPNVRAGRILSFQGRLTDTLSNPITTATNVTFRLYNVSTGGTALYTAGPCSITPDQDGIFNVLIGGSGYSPTPPQQVCGTEIPASVFTENANVYLGITIASDNEMTPRQQIANVGYAINAETLQGLPPGTQTSTIPYINQDGNLLIAASTPGIRSTFSSADFTLSSAKATIIQSAGAGDVILQATQSGILKFRVGGSNDVNNIMTLNTSGAEIFGNIYANSGQIRLGNFASSPSPIGSGSLYYNSTDNKIYYYNGASWTEIGSGAGESLWAQTLGILYPKNSTLDLAIGGTSTSSAKFAFTNINSGTPTFKINQNSNIDLVNSSVNALNIEGGLMNFDTQNSRIGIGTTTPQAKLDILGDIFSSGKGKIDYITDYSNENYGIDPAGTTNFGGYSLKIAAGALLAVDSGDVGIGTTGPQYKLDVNGFTRIQGSRFFLTGTESTYYNVISRGPGTNLGLAFLFRPDGSDDASGQISMTPAGMTIGAVTNSSYQLLDVRGIGYFQEFIYTGSNNTRFGAQLSGSSGGYGIFGSNLYIGGDSQYRTFGTHTGGYGYSGVEASWGNLKFYTQSGNTTQDQVVTPTTRMIITTTGNVGIGTTAPAAKLDVTQTGSQTTAMIRGNGGGVYTDWPSSWGGGLATWDIV
ncbi:MAG: site-specific integrase, partial [Candidatus Calescibacterium sp.]|nr:site-specific integrase [Candidatus Calescibacterium sp.]